MTIKETTVHESQVHSPRLRAALYLRKSRADLEAEARGDGETLAKHHRALCELADQHDVEIRRAYQEIASGEHILERPQMQQLLHDVSNGLYDLVLCMDLDRLGRGNLIDQGVIQETFKRSGTRIVTPRKIYDLRDELDEEWTEFESFLARRELKLITRRMQRGREQSVKAGRSISKRPPYGYLRTDELKLFPDPQTAPVVKWIYALASNSLGPSAIAERLRAMALPSPSGNALWSPSTVRFILGNPVYRGALVWGRVRSHKVRETERARYHRVVMEPDAWIVREENHEPIVDCATWERVNNESKRPPTCASANNKKKIHPLAGLIFCATCKRAMVRQPVKNRPHNALRCATKGCPTRSARYELVLHAVQRALSDQFRGVAITPNPEQTEFTAVSDSLAHVIARTRQAREEQLKRICEMYEQGVYTRTQFQARYDEVAEQLRQANESLEALKQERNETNHKTNRAKSALNARARCEPSHLFLSCKEDDLRALLIKSVRRIEYTRTLNDTGGECPRLNVELLF
ncbi:recombinase family protein [Ferroacidibacillus organovorans]|uniref:Recombinase family protein n=1 Tax=Ferroacidibacillus organovorans TaxID=1765683 RepID=A0A1V4EPK9_9BACL|nr:recombinase family protein [Ferroacidibacillus organovorans]OPG14859.1 hypothetical protein B2M26_14890 [Ferroacidibacillus organovorans]